MKYRKREIELMKEKGICKVSDIDGLIDDWLEMNEVKERYESALREIVDKYQHKNSWWMKEMAFNALYSKEK